MIRSGSTIVALVLLLPEIAAACATCFGAPDAPATKGMNNAILALLAVVGVVWVGIGKVALDFRRRSKRLGRGDEE